MALITPSELTRYDAPGNAVSSSSGTAKKRVMYVLKATTTAAADGVSIKAYDPELSSIDLVAGLTQGTSIAIGIAQGSATSWGNGTVVFQIIGDMGCLVYGSLA